MDLRTDDDTRRARMVWLGPPGYTLPIHLSYAQWALFGALALAFAGGGGLLLGWGFVGVGIAVAVVVTYLVSQAMNPDRTARQILRTVVRGWRQKRPTDTRALPRLTGAHIKIGGDPR